MQAVSEHLKQRSLRSPPTTSLTRLKRVARSTMSPVRAMLRKRPIVLAAANTSSPFEFEGFPAELGEPALDVAERAGRVRDPPEEHPGGQADDVRRQREDDAHLEGTPRVDVSHDPGDLANALTTQRPPRTTSREIRGTVARRGSAASIGSVAGRSRVWSSSLPGATSGVAAVGGPAETMSGRSKSWVAGPTADTSAVSISPGTRTGVRRFVPGLTPG
jgi:hypothetical protein